MNYFIFFAAVKGSTVIMAGGKEMQDPLEITVTKVLLGILDLVWRWQDLFG